MIRENWSGIALACLLALVLLVDTRCYAITASEKAALLQIIDNYPLLSHLPYQGLGNNIWDASQVDNVCALPIASHIFYGLRCTGDSVTEVSIDNQWGYPIRDQFDAFSGLSALQSFYFYPSTYGVGSVSTLIAQLPNITTLTELTITTQESLSTVLSQAIGDSVGLSDLSVTCDFSATSLDLSRLVLLRTLYLNDSRGGTANANLIHALDTANSTLQSLLFQDIVLPTSLSLSRFTVLINLNVRMASDGYFSLTDLSASSIEHLQLYNVPNSVSSLDFASFGILDSLVLIGGGSVSTITAWPPTIRQIFVEQYPNLTSVAPAPPAVFSVAFRGTTSFTSFPPGFFADILSNFRTLAIKDSPNFKTLPSELSASPMVTLAAWNTGINDPLELCKLPLTLQSLSLYDYNSKDGVSTGPFPFPPCLVNYTQLQTVLVGGVQNAPPNLTVNLPPTVTKLSITNSSLISFNWTSLPSIKSLTLNNCSLNGTFPNELSQIPTLGSIDLGGNSLTGTIVIAPIVIHGNLTAPTVTVANPSATITVKGCVSTETVVVVLTPAQVEALEKDPSKSKLLVTQLGSNCSISLSSVQVTSSVTKKSCRKVSATTDTSKSTPASLVATFNVNSSACQIWWIVLVSVLGGVIFVAVVATIVALKCKQLRA